MVEKWNSISDIDSPKNDTVFNNLVKAYSIYVTSVTATTSVSIFGSILDWNMMQRNDI